MAKRAKAFVMNVNDDIEVRLTPEGKTYYGEYYEKRYKMKAPVLRRRKGGWVRFQLHDLMKVFGGAMTMGGPLVFKKNQVRILPSIF